MSTNLEAAEALGHVALRAIRVGDGAGVRRPLFGLRQLRGGGVAGDAGVEVVQVQLLLTDRLRRVAAEAAARLFAADGPPQRLFERRGRPARVRERGGCDERGER